MSHTVCMGHRCPTLFNPPCCAVGGGGESPVASYGSLLARPGMCTTAPRAVSSATAWCKGGGRSEEGGGGGEDRGSPRRFPCHL